MIALMKNVWSDESGQGLTEYALILGLIAVVCITILTALGSEVARVFNAAGEQLNTANTQQQAVTGGWAT